MARETLSDAKTPEDTVLWLWRAHNRANKRLSGDASEDPHFPKQQFPPSSICPKCYAGPGNHDEAEVLRFLTQYYSDIKTDQVRVGFVVLMLRLCSILARTWLQSQRVCRRKTKSSCREAS